MSPLSPGYAHRSRGQFTRSDPRYLSRDACRDLFHRLTALSSGGGDTSVTIESVWRGHLRWALNRITTSGDTIDRSITVTRTIRGATGRASTNALDDPGLAFALRTAERHLQQQPERVDTAPPIASLTYLTPTLLYQTTLGLTAADRSAVGQALAEPVRSADLVSAGYVEVSAHTRAVCNTAGLFAYYAATRAQYSVTVRSPQDTASGWSGVDENDWSRIDAAAISRRALDKCITSKNAKVIEPGRYTAILEPQAVHDLLFPAIQALDRYAAESVRTAYTQSPGLSKIGQQLLDSRITVTTDPMDPGCGYMPFNTEGEAYQPTTWFRDGVLTELAYDTMYALAQLGRPLPRPNPYAYRMSGGEMTLDEMIASTQRGLLVTRLSDVEVIDATRLSCSGITRDGVWYIKDGAVQYPVKNFRFTESPLQAFNNVESLGVPQRVFARYPAVVPPVKVRDFGFTSLADAI